MIFKKILFLGTTHASVFDFKQCYIQGIICPVMTNSSFRSGKRLNILPISRIFNDHNPNSSTFEGLEFSFAISRTFQDFIYFLIIYLVTSFITYFAHTLIYLPKSYYLNLLAQPLTHSVTQLLACVADSCKHPCTQSDGGADLLTLCLNIHVDYSFAIRYLIRSVLGPLIKISSKRGQNCTRKHTRVSLELLKLYDTCSSSNQGRYF